MKDKIRFSVFKVEFVGVSKIDFKPQSLYDWILHFGVMINQLWCKPNVARFNVLNVKMAILTVANGGTVLSSGWPI